MSRSRMVFMADFACLSGLDRAFRNTNDERNSMDSWAWNVLSSSPTTMLTSSLWSLPYRFSIQHGTLAGEATYWVWLRLTINFRAISPITVVQESWFPGTQYRDNWSTIRLCLEVALASRESRAFIYYSGYDDDSGTWHNFPPKPGIRYMDSHWEFTAHLASKLNEPETTRYFHYSSFFLRTKTVAPFLNLLCKVSKELKRIGSSELPCIYHFLQSFWSDPIRELTMFLI